MKKLLSILLLVLTIMPTSLAFNFSSDSYGPSYSGGFSNDSYVRNYRSVSQQAPNVNYINSITAVESFNDYNPNYNYYYNADNLNILRAPVATNNRVVSNPRFRSYKVTNNNKSFKAYNPTPVYNYSNFYYTTPVYYTVPVYYTW
jgi:hypothetical protein